jgi:hypothetical protein
MVHRDVRGKRRCNRSDNGDDAPHELRAHTKFYVDAGHDSDDKYKCLELLLATIGCRELASDNYEWADMRFKWWPCPKQPGRVRNRGANDRESVVLEPNRHCRQLACQPRGLLWEIHRWSEWTLVEHRQ